MFIAAVASDMAASTDFTVVFREALPAEVSLPPSSVVERTGEVELEEGDVDGPMVSVVASVAVALVASVVAAAAVAAAAAAAVDAAAAAAVDAAAAAEAETAVSPLAEGRVWGSSFPAGARSAAGFFSAGFVAPAEADDTPSSARRARLAEMALTTGLGIIVTSRASTQDDRGFWMLLKK